jgi:hypothetical protein
MGRGSITSFFRSSSQRRPNPLAPLSLALTTLPQVSDANDSEEPHGVLHGTAAYVYWGIFAIVLIWFILYNYNFHKEKPKFFFYLEFLKKLTAGFCEVVDNDPYELFFLKIKAKIDVTEFNKAHPEYTIKKTRTINKKEFAAALFDRLKTLLGEYAQFERIDIDESDVCSIKVTFNKMNEFCHAHKTIPKALSDSIDNLHIELLAATGYQLKKYQKVYLPAEKESASSETQPKPDETQVNLAKIATTRTAILNLEQQFFKVDYTKLTTMDALLEQVGNLPKLAAENPPAKFTEEQGIKFYRLKREIKQFHDLVSEIFCGNQNLAQTKKELVQEFANIKQHEFFTLTEHEHELSLDETKTAAFFNACSGVTEKYNSLIKQITRLEELTAKLTTAIAKYPKAAIYALNNQPLEDKGKTAASAITEPAPAKFDSPIAVKSEHQLAPHEGSQPSEATSEVTGIASDLTDFSFPSTRTCSPVALFHDEPKTAAQLKHDIETHIYAYLDQQKEIAKFMREHNLIMHGSTIAEIYRATKDGKIPENSDYDFLTTTPLTDLLKVIPNAKFVDKAKPPVLRCLIAGKVVEITNIQSFSDEHLRVAATERDFSVAGLMFQLDRGLIDFVNGSQDLHKGCLRCIKPSLDTFAQDPYRLFRFLRYCERYPNLDPELEAFLKKSDHGGEYCAKAIELGDSVHRTHFISTFFAFDHLFFTGKALEHYTNMKKWGIFKMFVAIAQTKNSTFVPSVNQLMPHLTELFSNGALTQLMQQLDKHVKNIIQQPGFNPQIFITSKEKLKLFEEFRDNIYQIIKNKIDMDYETYTEAFAEIINPPWHDFTDSCIHDPRSLQL